MVVYYRKSRSFGLRCSYIERFIPTCCHGWFWVLINSSRYRRLHLDTLGMAVDANVLINERVRQELKAIKNAKNAVEQGFAKVFWTIIDANVTTLIAAVVLLETNSSGPIRGLQSPL